MLSASKSILERLNGKQTVLYLREICQKVDAGEMKADQVQLAGVHLIDAVPHRHWSGQDFEDFHHFHDRTLYVRWLEQECRIVELQAFLCYIVRMRFRDVGDLTVRLLKDPSVITDEMIDYDRWLQHREVALYQDLAFLEEEILKESGK